jgi:predicted branched-subunit amino acid permease
MPLHEHAIAMKIAVAAFFITAVVAAAVGVEPLTCCKRAVLGAVIGYVMAKVTVKIVNAVLINAMIKKQMEKEKENNYAA